MQLQRFCSVFLLATSLLIISMLTAGCYTQFATSDSIERISSPSEIDMKELVENGSNVTINNYYYDPYYAYYMRPIIYGFSSVWSWYDPFWGYPLWYTPVIVPIGVGWSWNRWRWNPYLLYLSSGGVASTEMLGTRRIGMGRTRTNGATNALYPSSSYPSTSSGASNDRHIDSPESRRQRGSITIPAPADARRRSSTVRAVEHQSDRNSKEQSGGYFAPSRRPSNDERRLPSYSAPAQRGSSSASAPSRSGGSSSSNSSSGSSGRRQR